MLTSWQLSHFKSVFERTTLKFEPLTLFTGANSAGKSTIIQSLLLTAQTLQSQVSTRPIVLNGSMARLGSFIDLVSSADEKQQISISFELKVHQGPSPEPFSAGRVWRSAYYMRFGTEIDVVSANFAFSIAPGPNDSGDAELLKLQPCLIEAGVSVAFKQDGVRKSDRVHVQRAKKSQQERAEELQLSEDRLAGNLAESMKFVVTGIPENGYRGRLDALEVSSKVEGALMYHFLPRALSVRFDVEEAIVASQFLMLTQPAMSRRQRAIFGDAHSRATAEAVARIRQLLLQFCDESSDKFTLSNSGRRDLKDALSLLEKDMNLEPFSTTLGKMLGRDSSQITSVLAAEKHLLLQDLKKGRGTKFDLEILHLGEHLSTGVEFVQNFFVRSVRYLGPLRDEPKPVYPLAGASDPADVGFRGEHTAAVLDVHKNSMVEYVPSAFFDTNSLLSPSPQRETLASAVRDWLEYMGVGRGFQTSDLGNLGHELKVMTPGSELKHDLTQVGVGVSQVLPILVLALLAESGSTLIFEQPELHLHPKVQSRLADFFVSMTMLGKQCIVETHSEYLINRLRLRAAADVGDDVAKSVVIYFVEREGSASNYREVRIDELGGLDSWPAGFFDESEYATTALLRQSMRKRKERM